MGHLARASMMVALGLSALTGCVSEESIRARAALAMNCPADEVWVEPGISPTRRAYGCNRTVELVCANTLRSEKPAFNGIAPKKMGSIAGSHGCVMQDENP